MHLAVDVGFSDVVEINQREARHAGSSRGLCSPRAHAAKAHDHDVRLTNTFGTLGTVEPGQTPEASLKVGREHSLVRFHALDTASGRALKPPHLVLQSGDSPCQYCRKCYTTGSTQGRDARQTLPYGAAHG